MKLAFHWIKENRNRYKESNYRNILDEFIKIVRDMGWSDPKATADKLEAFLDSKGYKLPEGLLSIHSEESIKFMEELVQPGIY